MRNITIIILAGTFFIFAGFAVPLKEQDVQKEIAKPKPIPAAVKDVLNKSCTGCHSEDGTILAKMKLNFTNWNEYSSDKQASSGQAICTEVTEDKMPPKKYLKKHPEVKLSDEEKAIVCSWTANLSAGK
jgi:uncharacterized membrane protein